MGLFVYINGVTPIASCLVNRNRVSIVHKSYTPRANYTERWELWNNVYWPVILARYNQIRPDLGSPFESMCKFNIYESGVTKKFSLDSVLPITTSDNNFCDAVNTTLHIMNDLDHVTAVLGKCYNKNEAIYHYQALNYLR